MNDQNTIFYGHNLLNGTAFGSIKKIFENPKNNKIMVITSDQKKYTYQIFSGYTIDPETYYLQTNFNSPESYKSFLDTLSNRNTINIDNSVDVNDKIITLSTCTDDNNGRRVIHAKLIS
jgi:sortase B